VDTKTVRDVIGDPEFWPNFMHSELHGSPDMRGAMITDVLVSGDQIAVQTNGAVCGQTFSTFVVEDRDLRERVTRVLRPALNVYEAVAAEI
jgi:hypothetical protein